MRLEPFAMERMQSTYENRVAINLSESGVTPLRLGELLEDADARATLMSETLRYTQTNGTVQLRALVAAQYPGATPDHVQITNGGAEANYVATWHLVEPGDEVVMMAPNYMQAWGLARAFGADLKPWPLVPPSEASPRWTIDIDLLARLVTPRTRIIFVCNPNNPTGARFEERDLDAIAAIAARHGTWILSDEIYRGAERDGRETPSLWGRTDRVVITSGLSKAYGLPGLRIGWAIGPPDLVESLWTFHDYTTIAPGALSDALACRALEPTRRQMILARTRRILNDHYPIVADWLDSRRATLAYAPPDAGGIVYIHYTQRINSTDLVTRLREEQSLLIVPGDHFGMDGYLRLGFGESAGHLRDGLPRLDAVLNSQ
jgi:aspartate/methionine/tyrosine aminotransferase